MQQPAVFLDRDGTIIEDTHYIRHPKDVRVLPEAVAGLLEMRRKGYLLFIVSNQSGVGRGIIKSEEFWAVHQRVCEVLQEAKVEIAEFGYCFHAPEDDCACRKPRAGLIPRRHEQVEIALTLSYTVGDKVSDLELADTIGGKGFLVLTGKGAESHENLLKSGRVTHYEVRADLAQVAASLPSLNK